MGRPNEKGINNQKVHKCILAKGDIAKYTQGYENFVGSHVFFVFFLLFAIKRCPHVLTMNLHADSIF